MSIVRLPLSRITDNPYQPRASYTGIEELAGSIEKDGLLQHPVARLANGEGRMARDEQGMPLGAVGSNVPGYLREHPEWQLQLAYGHRRIRALRLLAERRQPNDTPRDASATAKDDEVTVPIRVKIMTDEEMARHVGLENASREDLNPVERARYIEQIREEFGYTMADVGELFGKARSTISNWLRILELPEEVLSRVASGKMSERKAMALLPAYTLSEEEEAATSYILRGNLSPEAVLEAALDEGSTSKDIRKKAQRLKAHLADLAERARHTQPLVYVAFDAYESVRRANTRGLRSTTKVSKLIRVDGRLLAVTSTCWHGGGSDGGSWCSASAHEALTPDEFEARPERKTGERSTYGKEFTFDGETYVAGHRVNLVEREGGTEDVDLIRPAPEDVTADDRLRANDAAPSDPYAPMSADLAEPDESDPPMEESEASRENAEDPAGEAFDRSFRIAVHVEEQVAGMLRQEVAPLFLHMMAAHIQADWPVEEAAMDHAEYVAEAFISDVVASTNEHDPGAVAEALERWLAAVGTDVVDVCDPEDEAPEYAALLDRYSELVDEEGPEAIRALEEVRRDIDRRQEALPDAAWATWERDSLSDLRDAVQELLELKHRKSAEPVPA